MLEEKGMSERNVCRHLRLSRTTLRYREQPEDEVNVLIREELKRLSSRHRRYGTPRMTALLRRDGFEVNHKRVERIPPYF